MQHSVTAAAAQSPPRLWSPIGTRTCQELKLNCKRTGPFQKRDHPSDETDHRQSTTAISTNVVATTADTPELHTPSRTINSTLHLRSLCLRRLGIPYPHFIRRRHHIWQRTTWRCLFPTSTQYRVRISTGMSKCTSKTRMPTFHWWSPEIFKLLVFTVAVRQQD